MPTPFDLLTQQVDPPDPEDQLDQTVDQDQGANLAGAPQATPAAPPQVPPSSLNVPGPLAALAAKPVKPKIKLLTPPKKKPKPHIKLKLSAPKPHIKLKLGGSNGLRP